MKLLQTAGLALVCLTSLGSAAQAAVTLVNPVYGPTKSGRFIPFAIGSGTYGVELRGGNGTANGDWEIGVGRRTSISGAFTQGQRALGCVTSNANPQVGCGTVLPFSLTWSTTTLLLILGGTQVAVFDAPLAGDTLRIWAKRDATFTVTNLDGTAFALTGAGNGGGPSATHDFYLYSPDNWGGNGLTLTGTVRIAGGRGSSNEIFISHGSFIPEPVSWAMLIAGLGLVGAALRRQRMTPATVTS